MDKVNEKIEELIELCKQEDVDLAICASKNRNETNSTLYGSSASVAFNIYVIIENLKRVMDEKECTCSGCENLRRLLGIKSKIDQQKQKDFKHFDDLLNAFLRGGFQ